jgi:hypothetical protein
MRDKIEIKRLDDLDHAAKIVGLPVGPHTGPSKRTNEKREWYTLFGFLRATIPYGLVELPFEVRNGCPPTEPDFVMTHGGSQVGLFEITEATDAADHKEMKARELSPKTHTMLGEFDGRFKGGAGNPGIAWATDIVTAIRRKSGTVIFRDSSVPRHLIIYPNSNASFLLGDEVDELDAIDKLRAEIAKDAVALTEIANGCVVHILGKHSLCMDALRHLTVLTQSASLR